MPAEVERTIAADTAHADMRCLNPDCELFELRLERDEVEPTPGSQPDQCVSCGQPLAEYRPHS